MDFQKLHEGTDCDCIATAKQNCSDTFSRKTSDSTLKDRSFRLTKRCEELPFIDCENHCLTKSISIDIWNDDSAETLKQYYLQKLTSLIAPKFKDNLLIFKIKQYGGYVKHTPQDHNSFHYDYYKPDDFSVDSCLEHIKTIKLTPDAV